VIGIVVVSHSPALAEAAVSLALEMVHGERPRIAVAAGAGGGLTGTDATRVAAAIGEVTSPDGVLVLVDLGSALMSAELALEFLDEPSPEVRVTSAPFVEGLLAAVVRAAGGATLDEVDREARSALSSKTELLGEPALSVAGPPVAGPPAEQSATDLVAEFTLINPSGLHIRPASLIVEALTPLDAVVLISNVRSGGEPKLANSPTALLTVGAREGDAVRVAASGRDAASAVRAVGNLIQGGFGELQPGAGDDSEREPAVLEFRPQNRTPIGVSPGRAVGPVLRMPEPLSAPRPAAPIPEAERAADSARIETAAIAVTDALRSRAARVTGEASEILTAAAVMAGDPELIATARRSVTERGESPELAFWNAIGVVADDFSASGGRIAERVADLHDLRNRVVAQLLGRPEPGVPVRSEPFILIARDLAPADTALLDPAVCLAIVTVEGGPTSHTAILSRSLGLPALVSVTDALDIPEGTVILVDGTAGTLVIEPSDEQILSARQESSAALRFSGAGATSDGHRVELLANVGSSKSTASAVAAGAEGVGLFRTEFLFLDRLDAPSVIEQVAEYRAVFAAFAGRKVIVRTLDAGADKPLAFVSSLQEPNPALGVRGYRTTWRSPSLMDDQLAAIAEAARAERAKVQVMAPMIDTPGEAADFAHRAAEHGIGSVGVMIETPAAAITAPELLSLVDFASLGTNDLAQYTMAADRQVGELALLNDPWQPAVLRMMKLAFDAGLAAGKPISVCGEAAADPLLAAVLVGFGASSLSMSALALGHVGFQLASVSLDQCEDAAAAAVSARTATAARDAAVRVLRIDR
jgi:phosphoenolpyruvate-protein phosphotransferase/dihydroxyacetone kinase phosphotransfer subunit